MKTFKIKKGHNLKIDGVPNNDIVNIKDPLVILYHPNSIKNIKPKLLVKEGDYVKVGSPLFYDKLNELALFVSTCSGVVKSIKFGPRRVVECVEIENDGKNDKEEIFKTADIITVHTPLDSSTEKMFTEKVFSLMKQDSFLVNVARGGIVDQLALKKALLGNDIAGAAIDVFEMEPCDDFEFLQLPNLYCTPHTGGSSEQSMLAMGRSAINHLKKYFGL